MVHHEPFGRALLWYQRAADLCNQYLIKPIWLGLAQAFIKYKEDAHWSGMHVTVCEHLTNCWNRLDAHVNLESVQCRFQVYDASSKCQNQDSDVTFMLPTHWASRIRSVLDGTTAFVRATRPRGIFDHGRVTCSLVSRERPRGDFDHGALTVSLVSRERRVINADMTYAAAYEDLLSSMAMVAKSKLSQSPPLLSRFRHIDVAHVLTDLIIELDLLNYTAEATLQHAGRTDADTKRVTISMDLIQRSWPFGFSMSTASMGSNHRPNDLPYNVGFYHDCGDGHWHDYRDVHSVQHWLPMLNDFATVFDQPVFDACQLVQSVLQGILTFLADNKDNWRIALAQTRHVAEEFERYADDPDVAAMLERVCLSRAGCVRSLNTFAVGSYQTALATCYSGGEAINDSLGLSRAADRVLDNLNNVHPAEIDVKDVQALLDLVRKHYTEVQPDAAKLKKY